MKTAVIVLEEKDEVLKTKIIGKLTPHMKTHLFDNLLNELKQRGFKNDTRTHA